MVIIVPAILQESLDGFKSELEKVWSVAPRVQIDVIDGVFAPKKTVGPEVIREVETIVRFDVHLMVDKPEGWVGRVAAMGVDRVFGQVEMMADTVAFIEEAQFEGMEVGLAYDIETPIDGVEKYINDIDAVLLMAVKAGAQGNHFDERVFEKIKSIRKLNKRITIVIDGGLDEDKIRRCLAAEWAEELAEGELFKSTMGMEFSVGSHLLKSENVIEEYENLQHLKNNHG